MRSPTTPFRRRSSRPDPTPDPGTSAPEQAGAATPEVVTAALKHLGALLANVTVLTALLVYFGWARAEVHAAGLGIDESLLGMTARELTLRSVGSVVVLALGVCATGLLWLVVEPRLRRAVSPQRDGNRRWWRAALLRAFGLGWLLLPLLTRLLGEVQPVLATILFPASLGAGILLWSWTRSVNDERPSGSRTLTAMLTWSLVVVCLFWTATSYAQYSGRRLADDFASSIPLRPGVVVYSSSQLHLDGPGVVEQTLSGQQGETYRYDGLRFVEHTGGNYFLVSQGWSRAYGVFFLLPDDNPATRFEFVRGSP